MRRLLKLTFPTIQREALCLVNLFGYLKQLHLGTLFWQRAQRHKKAVAGVEARAKQISVTVLGTMRTILPESHSPGECMYLKALVGGKRVVGVHLLLEGEAAAESAVSSPRPSETQALKISWNKIGIQYGWS